MGKNKLKKFEEIRQFKNVLELTDFGKGKSTKPRGKWNSDIFENDHPITLELACGKGEYTIELARRHPERNYVGVDIKGARIWKGAKQALSDKMENVRFLRIYIDHLNEYFGPAEVDEIWITFPDPYPKYSDRNRRLTSPKFLKIYRKVLKEEGVIHLKTDSDGLFNYTVKVIVEEGCRIIDRTRDIYQERSEDPLLTLHTYYERIHLNEGKTIKYVSFILPEG